MTGDGKAVGAERPNDQEVARLINAPRSRPACAAIFRKADGKSCLPAIRCVPASPRSTSQKQLDHASAEMTRKYQRRSDRFRINVTQIR
ncbi:putative phage integrase [Mesorhizobium alhagi CCNWXJ12-2]|uniref:Putative phage integrase n=1 Tax=Mesorhizobium alhagi CCNWXJ12-2 TaxID=1107882 RepID=H0HXA0_9HYPH|nr:putative phage integrase [Mesorhizobium alhagi CCNWXJ12-2]